ncbi:hypothetical protein A9Q81_11620 [Gammaproteobacteria bacterium 42_54_T18]|nr:hypothetical protein A9Q81_11620 [Gammaproteobacteria bacterium 42_54_T18]
MPTPYSNFVNSFTALNANGRANDANQRADNADRRAGERHQTNLRATNLNIKAAEGRLADKEWRDYSVGVKGKLGAGGSLAPEDLSRIFEKMGVENPAAFMRDDYATNFDIAGKAFTGKLNPNSQPVLSAANNMWGGVIKKAVGQKTADGRKIVDQRIVGMAPSKDGQGVMLELANMTEDGEWRTSPMTEKRSTDQKGDPYVKVISYDSMMQQVQGQQLLHKIRNQKQLRGAFDALVAASSNQKRTGGLSVPDRMALNQQQHELNMKADAASDNRRATREDAKSATLLKKQKLGAINNLISDMIGTRDEQMVMDPDGTNYIDDETVVAIAKSQVDPELLTSTERQLLDSRRKLLSRRAAESVLESEREKADRWYKFTPTNEDVYEKTESDPDYRGPNLRAMLSNPQPQQASPQGQATPQQDTQAPSSADEFLNSLGF